MDELNINNEQTMLTMQSRCNAQVKPTLVPNDMKVSQEYSANNSKKQHRVMIFADQTGYGVRQILQYYLGDSFSVISVIKTNATIDEVLKSCIPYAN